MSGAKLQFVSCKIYILGVLFFNLRVSQIYFKYDFFTVSW